MRNLLWACFIVLSSTSLPAAPPVPDSVTWEEAIEYSNPDDTHLQMNLARPKTGNGPFPTVLCIHGGGFRVGKRESYDTLCVKLAERGYVAATMTYRLTSKLPKSETYGLASQMQRASVSIAANIAEGHGREQTGSFIQFLRVAQGSLKELETHLMLGERVEVLERDQAAVLLSECERVSKMLRNLIRSLQSKIDGTPE